MVLRFRHSRGLMSLPLRVNPPSFSIDQQRQQNSRGKRERFESLSSAHFHEYSHPYVIINIVKVQTPKLILSHSRRIALDSIASQRFTYIYSVVGSNVVVVFEICHGSVHICCRSWSRPYTSAFWAWSSPRTLSTWQRKMPSTVAVPLSLGTMLMPCGGEWWDSVCACVCVSLSAFVCLTHGDCEGLYQKVSSMFCAQMFDQGPKFYLEKFHISLIKTMLLVPF